MDDLGRPRVLLLSAGNTNDITMAATLIRAAGPIRRLLADRGYDADHLRKLLADQGAEAVIPSTTSRRAPIPYDVIAYRDRNRVERMWCRLKDFRRVATRYDKLARNYLAGAFIAATYAHGSTEVLTLGCVRLPGARRGHAHADFVEFGVLAAAGFLGGGEARALGDLLVLLLLLEGFGERIACAAFLGLDGVDLDLQGGLADS